MHDLMSEDKKAGKLSASLSPEGPNVALSDSLQISIRDRLKNVFDYINLFRIFRRAIGAL